MKKSLSRVVSFFTAFLILFVGSAFHAAADNSLNTEELVILPISDIPEVISYEDAIDRGHVERLKSEETDMHSVIFRNSDGTKSLYMFASPIKYAASDGSVKDKRTDISITANGFGVTDNDVKLTFGNTSANATTVVNNGNTVKITPNGSNDADGILQNNTMVYNGVFGDNTMLVYTPLLSGLKAGIILRSQGEINSFSFDLEAIGLTPSASVDGVINLNNTDSETIFEIGTYLVTDANGKYTEGEMILSGNATDGYTVTANVDEAFLNAEDTAYPVIVEPNITLNTSSAIDDAVIYSEKPNKAYGAYKYNNIGYLDSYGIGRLLVKFPGLGDDNSTFSNLKVAQIRSAEYCMYTASSRTGDGSYPYNATLTSFIQHDEIWSENTVSWNTFYADVSTTNSGSLFISMNSTTVSNSAAQSTSISLTVLAKQWVTQDELTDTGILVVNVSESTTSNLCRDFCSTEYADSNNGNLMPYLTINYGTAQYATVRLNISVDDAFIYRARTLHPDAISDLVAVRLRLIQVFGKTIQVYKERFGISITYTISLNGVSSIDSCNTAASAYNSKCSCYDTCQNYNETTQSYTYLHHTNQYRVIGSISNGSADTGIHAFFTGHKTCSATSNNMCINGSADGLATPVQYKFAIFNCTNNDTTKDKLIQVVVAHELGHIYGVDDHYREYPDFAGHNDYCIWGDENYRTTVVDNFMICYRCTYNMLISYDKFNHS